jgi:hypothetical protein
MRFSVVIRNSIWLAAFCLYAQEPAPTAGAASPTEAVRMPPRGGPNDYQAHAKVGPVTIGAEFMRHSVPTPEAQFNTEEYVVVELGMFGAPGTKTKISIEDFSLRINGKKALASQPYGLVFPSLKDPEWQPPEAPKPKSGGLSTGGEGAGGGGGDPPPLPPKMPLPLVHVMQLKVQKAAIPEGERVLPEAGLLFFFYRGASDKIKSVELTYSGPAGKATLALQP